MNKEIIFSDLYEISAEKDRISTDNQKDKWRSVSYKTGICEGKMLTTPEWSYPEKVTLNLNLQGTYQIYLGLPRFQTQNSLYVKLTDDICYSNVRGAVKRIKNWRDEEFIEEVYWKTADLTGQALSIAKSDLSVHAATSISWIRCVPADEKDLCDKTPVKCMQMHIDSDAYFEDFIETDDDYLARIYPMKDSNAEFVSYEVSFDYDRMEKPESYDGFTREFNIHEKGIYAFHEKKDIVYNKIIDFSHKSGFDIYAAYRMEVGNFTFPMTRYGINTKFPCTHEAFYCKTRTGTTVSACSYAYDEVQDYVIESLKNAVNYGFDGVTLIYHRGLHIAFEKPVVERFKKLYPDIDPCVLPFKDERLHNVLCSFMNEFMQKLRNALGNKKINVILDYSLETSKYLGLDAEYWAKNGLVDKVSQGDMETFEDLEGLMQDENPEYIDLDKYNKALCERTVVKRSFATNVPKVLENIPKYQKLKEYGVDVYCVIPWVHTIQPEEYDEIIEQMKKAGAEKFHSWNTNHLVWDLPEWYVVSKIGNARDDSIVRRKFYRVLSLNGHDISQFYHNWKG